MGVTVRLADAFRLVPGDSPVREPVIGSPKERRRLALLAVYRNRTVLADRIVDVLWDGHPPRRAEENVPPW